MILSFQWLHLYILNQAWTSIGYKDWFLDLLFYHWVLSVQQNIKCQNFTGCYTCCSWDHSLHYYRWSLLLQLMGNWGTAEVSPWGLPHIVHACEDAWVSFITYLVFDHFHTDDHSFSKDDLVFVFEFGQFCHMISDFYLSDAAATVICRTTFWIN